MLHPFSSSSPPIAAWATLEVLRVTMLLSLASWSVSVPPSATGCPATT